LGAGRFDAITALEPFRSKLVGQGYKDIGDPFSALGDSVASAVYMSTTSWVSSNAPALAAWRAAMQEADDFIANDSAAAKAVLAKNGIAVADDFKLATYATALPPNTMSQWLNLMKTVGGFGGNVDAAGLTAP
jgi:hypothetical protein